MKRHAYLFLSGAIALCLCLFTLVIERASGAIPEPAIILLGDSGARNFEKLRTDAAGAYSGVLGKCGIDSTALPYRLCDFNDGEVRKRYEKTFSVTSRDLPLSLLGAHAPVSRMHAMKNNLISFLIFAPHASPGELLK
jgi:hypothetical protein